MSNLNMLHIHGSNLSEAWGKALIECSNKSFKLAPVTVSFDVKEDELEWHLEIPEIRNSLEDLLSEIDIESVNQSNIETVSGTIFPESIWKRCNGSREMLFKEYDLIWPFLKKCSANRWGTYFRRMTSFGKKEVNQLGEVIDTWNEGIRRRSAFQVGIFDPTQDHRRTPYLGFPCLQQVVFHPLGPNGSGGMIVVAFYANQYLIGKAYGNYLGLYRLGKFMADEMGMILRGVTCIASNMSSKYGKAACSPLLKVINKELINVG